MLRPDELRKAAEQAVDEAIAKVETLRRNGGLQEINRRYKSYRLQQIALAEPMAYSQFLERRVETILRDVAAHVLSA